MKKIICDINDGLHAFSEQTILAGTVGGPLNHKPQTPCLSYISNAAVISLKLLLSVGQNISSKKWLCDLSLDEDYNFLPIIFYSQPLVEHTLCEKKEVLWKLI